MQYFAGGFNGGSKHEYLKMSKELSDNIDEDFNNGIIAVWHDESHMNRYFINNPPTKILGVEYCTPSNLINKNTKLSAIVKDHEYYR
jgi:histo-blood group ABO system transferase